RSTHNTRIECIWVEVGGRFAFLSCDEWNAHPISGEGHNLSPNDLRFTGQLEHGIYMSHGEVTIHPGVVQHYLGSTSIQLSQSSQISPSSDMDDQEWEEIPLETTDLTMIASLIAEEQTAQFLHEGAQVPRDHNPFSHSGAETVFTEALEEVQAIGYIPSGLGMLEEEWDGDGYPELEVI
ncbi:hypothetical protein SCLCIDRAFT_39426, partial [Scleroderma citrinum Foug A]